MQFSDAAVQGQLTGKTEIAIRALLGPELKDPSMAVHRGAQGLVLGETEPHRFFQINVLSRLDRRQRHQHVPVVRGSGKDYINVIACN